MEDHQATSQAVGTLRVFIVEDSPNMQVALGDLVCEVVDARICGVVTSEAMAIEWTQTNSGEWDLAIVDLTLEQGDGFNIVRHLAQRSDRGTVIVFSGFVTDVIRRYCMSLGADAVFHKTESGKLAQFLEAMARGRLAN